MNQEMKIHFRKNTRWMIDSVDFHSPFKPIEGPIIYGGLKKHEMPKNVDALIEGFDIAPRGTIDRLMDIIEKECPQYIMKRTIGLIDAIDEEQTHETVESRTIISDSIVGHNSND